MTNLPIKHFESEAGSLRMIEKDGEPWFVLTDICAGIGLKNPSKVAEKLDNDERGITLSYTNAGQRETIIVSESGMYTIILRSDAAITPGTTAHRFRKWVTGEILPSIRKEGVYGERKLSVSDETRLSTDLSKTLARIKAAHNRFEREYLYQRLLQISTKLNLKAPTLHDLLTATDSGQASLI